MSLRRVAGGEDVRATFKLASVLLQYPSPALFAGLDALDAFAAGTGPKPSRAAFAAFLGWLRTAEPSEVSAHYVRTFDQRRRCAPYLTYFRYGDTRKRGMAMVVFKTAYRDAGFAPDEAELPDYLPMVLDFAALCDRGHRLLHQHRADLELLRRALARAGSPYAEVVVAVSSALPGLGKRELDQVGAAWAAGPPGESVGIDHLAFGPAGQDASGIEGSGPFAPPEYLWAAGDPGGYPTGTAMEVSR